MWVFCVCTAHAFTLTNSENKKKIEFRCACCCCCWLVVFSLLLQYRFALMWCHIVDVPHSRWSLRGSQRNASHAFANRLLSAFSQRPTLDSNWQAHTHRKVKRERGRDSCNYTSTCNQNNDRNKAELTLYAVQVVTIGAHVTWRKTNPIKIHIKSK